jgi:hypothetical protein
LSYLGKKRVSPRLELLHTYIEPFFPKKPNPMPGFCEVTSLR